METIHFLVRRERASEHTTMTVPRDELPPDAVELRVDRFGFTANNLTYAALGDALAYWSLFPSPRPDWGRVPVWGFGTAVRSAVNGVAVGERFYGFFPMSSHVVVQPRRIDEAGFLDGAPNRRALSAVYNQYLRTTTDPSYRADTEPHQAVLRSLFATSYFLADYLDEHRWFGADTAVVSSASSKLALGTAFVLAGARRAGRQLVGLTSARNVDLVTRQGLYDRVLAYDKLSAPPAGGAVFVDVAGSEAVRAAVRGWLGGALRHTVAIGATHGGVPGAGAALGSELEMLFVPDWIKRRSRDWTPSGVQQRVAEAWQRFLVPLLDPALGWMTMVASSGPAAVARAYDDAVAGRVPADHGHVLSLAPVDGLPDDPG